MLDKYYEDLEFQALNNEAKDYCHKCNSVVEKDYKFCWDCWEELHIKCDSCKKNFFRRYKICPHCWEKKSKDMKKKEKEKKGDSKQENSNKKSK